MVEKSQSHQRGCSSRSRYSEWIVHSEAIQVDALIRQPKPPAQLPKDDPEMGDTMAWYDER